MSYEVAIRELEHQITLNNMYLSDQEKRIPELEEQLAASKAYKDRLEAEIQGINDAITKLKGN